MTLARKLDKFCCGGKAKDMTGEKKVTDDRISEVVRGFIGACVKDGRDPLARFLELCKTHNIRTMDDIGIKFADR